MSSSTTTTNQSTKSDEQNPSRMTDIALRKKKNADAQAAFRARRTNYITTLEETVVNLESVVRVLQDSCREATTEAQELQQENNQLRQALRNQENFWRASWPKRGQNSETESEFPSYPSPPSTTFNSTQYPDNSLGFNQYPASPSVSFNHQNQPYTSWTQTSSHSSNSPHFVESPTLTSASDMNLIGNRYPDDQKIPLNNLEPTVVPYVFPNSRSISPSSSTPPSSSTTALTSPFPFAFNDAQGAAQDRPEFEYRRQTTQSHGAEVISLHGGTADISAIASSSGNDGGVRYRLGGNNRRMDAILDRTSLLPLLPPITSGTAGSENDSQQGSQHGSDGGDSSYSSQHQARPRRITAPSSRSPSPGVAPLSGTLAVIKAQAFGALRRTRVRSKRPADGPAKVSRDVLESRGIVSADSLLQPGPAKRRRMNDDSDDFDAPS
ncbi:hypothetical protein F5879DRAFT_965651 [Lentinula edodes]|uniref:uncharacterized protein n=1 Tax=Lentinula edodes TaxID=5353 RepID=UPI001E8D3257|nr:uncharacterized protein C8R40DRAFT_1081387 [Lentinula edodes]KAH7880699.1 hypothetical protein C8R40DRAFT_1081387 [Lentinula edodes]KAJ3902100.1 hypothetical protein F5879DRAFT_965651 [Lentinula edodes]KAJ3919058.1 hypothetical protein F5877DRAFT_41217 [Lentinula edodes]